MRILKASTTTVCGTLKFKLGARKRMSRVESRTTHEGRICTFEKVWPGLAWRQHDASSADSGLETQITPADSAVDFRPNQKGKAEKTLGPCTQNQLCKVYPTNIITTDPIPLDRRLDDHLPLAHHIQTRTPSILYPQPSKWRTTVARSWTCKRPSLELTARPSAVCVWDEKRLRPTHGQRRRQAHDVLSYTDPPRLPTATSPASALPPTASSRPRTTPLFRSPSPRSTSPAVLSPARTTFTPSAVSSAPWVRPTMRSTA